MVKAVSDMLLSQAEIDALLSKKELVPSQESPQDSLDNHKRSTSSSRKESGLSHTGRKVKDDHPNLDLILDIPLKVTVNLGEVEKTIQEVLALNTGTIVEMDRLAGNPVDILLNGKLIAHGEVVVIEENFAVRVSYILSPGERVRRMV